MAHTRGQVMLCQAQGVNANLALRFVINQLAPRTALAREVPETLADADLPVLPTYVHDRQLYRRVVAQGGSVISEPGLARDEILALMKDVLDTLLLKPRPKRLGDLLQ